MSQETQQEDVKDGNLFDTLNEDVESSTSPWTDIGLFAIGLYVLLGWFKVCVWLIQKPKIKIPFIILLCITLVHGLGIMFSPNYVRYLTELGRKQDAERASR